MWKCFVTASHSTLKLRFFSIYFQMLTRLQIWRIIKCSHALDVTISLSINRPLSICVGFCIILLLLAVFFLLLRVTCCFWRCNCMTLDVEVSSVHVSSPLCSPSIYFLPCSSFVSTEKIESRHFFTYHTSCFCGTNWAEASCIDFFKMIDGWVQGVLAKGLFILTCALALICTSANCFLLV